jgi:hypothetical protein
MDPYLEAPEGWLGFHNHLAAEICAALNSQIQPRYFAELSSHVTYEVIEIDRSRGVLPDVIVSQLQPRRGDTRVGTATITPPSGANTVPLELEIHLDRVEVRAIGGGQLVTLIEILSPSNKRPSHEAHGEYLRKRKEILRSQVHLLEIDLLRAGTRPPLEEPIPEASYYAVLSRANHRPRVDVWAMQLLDRLPVLPVPLLEPDPDVPLDLHAVVSSVYERGAYGIRIDYSEGPPPPPLGQEDAAGLDALLRERGLRR